MTGIFIAKYKKNIHFSLRFFDNLSNTELKCANLS